MPQPQFDKRHKTIQGAAHAAAMAAAAVVWGVGTLSAVPLSAHAQSTRPPLGDCVAAPGNGNLLDNYPYYVSRKDRAWALAHPEAAAARLQAQTRFSCSAKKTAAEFERCMPAVELAAAEANRQAAIAKQLLSQQAQPDAGSLPNCRDVQGSHVASRMRIRTSPTTFSTMP